MKVYIDFDGVILNTQKTIVEEYHKISKINPDGIHEYFSNIDWNELIKKSKIIASSIELIKNSKLDIAILTKINSLDNEGIAKINYLKHQGITNEIILVPYNIRKCDIVSPIGNILIDDTLNNLDEWVSCGGTAIFFNEDDMNIDSWHNKNTKYKKVSSLEILKILEKSE